ncbi:TPA: hypothetical protein DIC39_01565 [Patescibacteria group bacterium]|nr:hypothetical protein [Patescibacteria group bacterium]HCU47729.1 hypothetical protein [Patescibacteria group bacterium]
MHQQTFVSVAAWFFLLVAILHLMRAGFGWGVVVGPWQVPFWFSWAAAVAGTYLAYAGFTSRR